MKELVCFLNFACACPLSFLVPVPAGGPSREQAVELVHLPYRLVFAVASEDSVLFYDTQQLFPFGYVSNIHYHTLSDISWCVMVTREGGWGGGGGGVCYHGLDLWVEGHFIYTEDFFAPYLPIFFFFKESTFKGKPFLICYNTTSCPVVTSVGVVVTLALQVTLINSEQPQLFGDSPGRLWEAPPASPVLRPVPAVTLYPAVLWRSSAPGSLIQLPTPYPLGLTQALVRPGHATSVSYSL